MKHFSQITHAREMGLVIERLRELLQLAPEEVHVDENVRVGQREIDARVQTPTHTFAVEFKANSSLASIVMAIEKLRSLPAPRRGPWWPLLVTRSMTPAGRQHCQEAGISWLDLAGNAHIEAPGLYVHVEGRPNPFKPPGRPSSVFAPKSSRIARWLLMHPNQFFSQRELAQATSMDEGFTSRIVARLEDERLVRRNRQGQLRVSNPDLLLDAWAEEYDFFKHEVHPSHLAARSGQALLPTASSKLSSLGWDSYATGLAGAWLVCPFAEFRLTTLYLKARAATPKPWPGSQREPAGANLWLVWPNDEGVFQGSEVYAEGQTCVHPVQVWLDLRAHPERSAEAAEQLRSTFPWRTHAR